MALEEGRSAVYSRVHARFLGTVGQALGRFARTSSGRGSARRSLRSAVGPAFSLGCFASTSSDEWPHAGEQSGPRQRGEARPTDTRQRGGTAEGCTPAWRGPSTPARQRGGMHASVGRSLPAWGQSGRCTPAWRGPSMPARQRCKTGARGCGWACECWLATLAWLWMHAGVEDWMPAWRGPWMSSTKVWRPVEWRCVEYERVDEYYLSMHIYVVHEPTTHQWRT